MEVQDKLRILADAAKYDASCASSGSKRARSGPGLGNTEGMGICHSFTPDGRCVSLLKILLTNYCIYDCTYCVNRISSDTPRARFTVEEVVNLTLEFYRRNYIEGLFLSSGVIRDSDYTMEQLAEVARQLREDHQFGGYIHLKAVAGASQEAYENAGKYADRLSANIELPTEQDIQKLAPAKSHAETEQAMSQIQFHILDQQDRGNKSFTPAGQSTQMIVGATPSSDASVLTKASQLYSTYGLRRVYYTAFSPIPHASSALPVVNAPLVREHRLYQADWLMRFYGFEAQELATGEQNLSLERDPKLDWALRHREFFPVDVNSASLAALLRVPGIGVRNAKRIVQVRKYRRLNFADLAKLQMPMGRVRYFITAADANPAAHQIDRVNLPQRLAQPRQANLFETATTAVTGQL